VSPAKVSSSAPAFAVNSPDMVCISSQLSIYTSKNCCSMYPLISPCSSISSSKWACFAFSISLKELSVSLSLLSRIEAAVSSLSPSKSSLNSLINPSPESSTSSSDSATARLNKLSYQFFNASPAFVLANANPLLEVKPTAIIPAITFFFIDFFFTELVSPYSHYFFTLIICLLKSLLHLPQFQFLFFSSFLLP